MAGGRSWDGSPEQWASRWHGETAKVRRSQQPGLCGDRIPVPKNGTDQSKAGLGIRRHGEGTKDARSWDQVTTQRSRNRIRKPGRMALANKTEVLGLTT